MPPTSIFSFRFHKVFNLLSLNDWMHDILRFPVTRAEAERDSSGNLTVTCYYPRNPTALEGRLKENLPFGINVFQQLLHQGYARLGDEQHPFLPPSAGSLYQFTDGKIVLHRRDKDAPTHKMYHSLSAGYPSTLAETATAEGLRQLALRESAEECLLVTRDKTPWLIVPDDCRELTIASAQRLGLNLKYWFVEVETATAPDTLNVCHEDGQPLFTTTAFLDFIYESCMGFNALQIRRIPLSSEEIVPIDAETFQGRHLNRESYLLHRENLAHLRFGQALPAPEVYQTRIVEGKPLVFAPKYAPPFLGPDALPASDPHLFAPDNMLVRLLDGLGVPGYQGKWMDIELWKESTKLAGESFLAPAAQKRLEEIMHL